MSEHDLAQVVAALSFPIATELGLADTPATEPEMRQQIAALIQAGGEPEPDRAAPSPEGVGQGLDLPTVAYVAGLIIQTLLSVSIERGFTGTFDALRHWRLRRNPTIPGLGALVAQHAAIRKELERRIEAQGLDPEQAQHLADMAVHALSELSRSTEGGTTPGRTPPRP